MEAPFTEYEKRFILSEAIKTSSVPVDKLLMFIKESGIQPVWAEAFLPSGRNLNSCITAWKTLRAGPPSSNLPIPAPERKRKSAQEGLEHFQTGPPPKRRQSGADTMIRIQPKPSSNGSPLSFSTSPATQPKKRGRPSKADVEARNAAAIARGEVIPPPKTPAARERVGGEASAGTFGSSGGFRGLMSSTPLLRHAHSPDPRMSTSFLSGRSDDEAGDEASKKKRGRPGSRSSKVENPFGSQEPQADKFTKEPRPGEGIFSTFGPSSSPFGVPKPPTTEPLERSAPPANLHQGAITAPVYPAIDALLSPEPPRPERSGP